MAGIFRLAVEDYYLTTAPDNPCQPESSLDTSGGPWVLAQVSRSWRTHSLALPELWSIIKISCTALCNSAIDDPALLHEVFLLGTQLLRSASHPLNVFIVCNHEFQPSHPILLILLPTYPRWTSCHLDIQASTLKSLLLIRHLPSVLTELDIELHYSEDHEIEEALALPLFRDALSLRTLRGSSLVDVPWWCIEKFVNLKWSYVTEEYIDLLQSAPNLQHMAALMHGPEGPLPELVIIRHNKITSLDLVLCEFSVSFTTILSYVSLPQLQYLSLDLGPCTHVNEVIDFLERSQCALDALSLTAPHASEDECLKLLRKVPTSRSLTLHCPSVRKDHLFNLMCDDSVDTMVLPALQFLEFLGFPVSGLDGLRRARPHLHLA